MFVLTTFPSAEAPAAEVLVSESLAACVNLLPGIELIYQWEGKMERKAEVLAIIKTTSAAWPSLDGPEQVTRGTGTSYDRNKLPGPEQVTDRNKLPTGTSYRPEQVTDRNKLPTGTSYRPEQVTPTGTSYRNKLPTGTRNKLPTEQVTHGTSYPRNKLPTEQVTHGTSYPGTYRGRVTRTFDSLNRLDKLDAQWGTGTGYVAPQVDYGFDSTGLLSTVSTAGRTITTTYAGNTRQWGTRTSVTGNVTRLTATRTLDSAGRTNYVVYIAGGSTMQSFTYTYDRDKVTKMVREQGLTADEMAWIYGYDAKGQVTNADKRFTSGGSPGNPPNTQFLAGYQTGYTYDEAGNRATKIEGGTATEDNGTRTTNYTTINALNQYTAIEHPNSGTPAVQSFEVTGRRSSGSNAITVNASGTNIVYQTDGTTGLHYSKALTHTATTGAGSYESVTVQEAGSTIDSGNYYLPPTTESPSYDADGNLTQDGRFNYKWDAENRLTSLTTRHTASSTYPGLRLTFAYDGLSRRIAKKVEKTTNGSTWTFETLETFLYDGWNLILRASHNSSAALIDRQSYVWGPDMASRSDGHSSWQAAGGIGGLVLVLDKNATAATSAGDNYYPLADRMGNITGYIKADSASVTHKALTSNVATITTSAPHGFSVGQSVTVALSPSDTVFNGTWTLTAVTSQTFSFARTNANITKVSTGGTATQAAVLAASYDYDAFGREMKSLGSAADKMPFRFSSKYTDGESGLVYYGYRYYDTAAGRWLNRDPIGEVGAINLYSFADNSPMEKIDYLGLNPKHSWPEKEDLQQVEEIAERQKVYRKQVRQLVKTGDDVCGNGKKAIINSIKGSRAEAKQQLKNLARGAGKLGGKGGKLGGGSLAGGGISALLASATDADAAELIEWKVVEGPLEDCPCSQSCTYVRILWMKWPNGISEPTAVEIYNFSKSESMDCPTKEEIEKQQLAWQPTTREEFFHPD